MLRAMKHTKPTRTTNPLRTLALAAALGAPFLIFGGLPMSAQPIVIAHRGASGYLPEHTLPAYAMAFALGADSIEPDLVRTRDGHFICLHDIHLEATTDVEEKFPQRSRADGRWYAADFSLAEIKTLRAHERLPGRFPQENAAHFEIPTFEEMVELVQGLERSTGRTVSIYPELKAPSFHRAEELPMEEAFLALVRRYGYRGPSSRIFVQCFEREPLVRLRALGSQLPQIYLLGDDQAARDATSDKGLDSLAGVANGIGPSKLLIEKDPELVKRAHARGLLVHPYTFRADDVGKGYTDVDAELAKFYFEYGVDGLFTDFPDRARAVLERRER
jgi:glycerophosphoryl diester phosphodiesterase